MNFFYYKLIIFWKNWLELNWFKKKSEGIRALWVLRIWKLNFIMLLCNCITVQSVLRFKFVSFDSVWVWVCDEKSMIKSKIVKVHAYDMKQLWVGTEHSVLRSVLSFENQWMNQTHITSTWVVLNSHMNQMDSNVEWNQWK